MSAKKLPEMDQQEIPVAKRPTLEFVRPYYKIADPIERKRIFELTKSIANAFSE